MAALTIRPPSVPLVAALVLFTSQVYATSYTATLLHPAGFDSSRAQGVSGSSQVGYGDGTATGGARHALLWNGAASSLVDLNPVGFSESQAQAISGTRQAGYGKVIGLQPDRALLWNGTAASAIDLTPAGLDRSNAYGVWGTSVVGRAEGNPTAAQYHAQLWSGTAASAVDLNPAGYAGSRARAVWQNVQVGEANYPFPNDNDHAMLWTGTAASAVDLHPAGFDESSVRGVWGTIQIGQGTTADSNDHALLWHGTAASVVDLTPVGCINSVAEGVSSKGEVGYAWGTPTGGNQHAFYWNGTKETAVDLHSYLAGLTTTLVESEATGIDDNGNISGIGYDADENLYAILWTALSGVLGDYNNNGKVDASDYVRWRKGTAPLYNEVATIGSNTPQDYTEWRSRFGNPPGSGSSIESASVPEPSTLLLLGIGAISRLGYRKNIRRLGP